LPILF